MRNLYARWPAIALDPDDGSAGGAPAGDPPPDPVAAAGDVKAAALDASKAVADSIKQAIEAARAAAPVAPVASSPSMADRQAALQREADEVNVRIDALAADGKVAEALVLRDTFQRKVSTAFAPSIDDDPTVQTAVEIGERLARAENRDFMTKYGDEVKRAVAAMPAAERIKPNAWDRAMQTVKVAHFDEIVNERVESAVTARRAEFMPPEGAPYRSRKREGAAAKLNEEQLWGMDITGVDAETYTKHVKIEEEFDKLPISKRGPGYGYPVMEATTTIAPGKF
jgi:hypothetical protein